MMKLGMRALNYINISSKSGRYVASIMIVYGLGSLPLKSVGVM
jgi:hypothetical protein